MALASSHHGSESDELMNRNLLILPAAAALVLGACGGDDSSDTAASDDRVVEVRMVDIAFEPETISVEAGETVTFEFVNDGEVAHDAYVGDAEAQDEHEAEMRDAEGDEHGGHGGGDDDAITVEPGESGELTHTFAEAGTVEIGCHQPGHYDAGMKIEVEVA